MKYPILSRMNTSNICWNWEAWGMLPQFMGTKKLWHPESNEHPTLSNTYFSKFPNDSSFLSIIGILNRITTNQFRNLSQVNLMHCYLKKTYFWAWTWKIGKKISPTLGLCWFFRVYIFGHNSRFFWLSYLVCTLKNVRDSGINTNPFPGIWYLRTRFHIQSS